MKDLKINLIKTCSEQSQTTYSEQNRTIKEEFRKKSGLARFIKFIVYFLIFLGLVFLFFFKQVIFSNESLLESFPRFNFISSLTHFIKGADKSLLGEENNRVNLLLLGMGGGEHQGALLTDTIILVSFEPQTKKVALLSIPRDLIAPIPGYGWRKINSANAFGEIQNPGFGAELTRQVLSQVLDLYIPYYIRVDFEAFRKAVDDVGGIKIYVENSFTDPLYPDEKFSYQTVSFKKGWQTMNGEEALKFVRSRHGNNGEGSDFARSRRQQKVLLALKEKIGSLNFLINPKNIANLLENFKDHIKTNLNIWEIIRLVKLGKEIDTSKIINQVLEEGEGGPLVAIMFDGAYLLQPKAGNFSEIQEIAHDIFNLNLKKEIKEKSKNEEARIEIQNGTKKEGLAFNTAMMLRGLGYEVVKIGNAKTQNYEKTVIYDLTQGQKPNTLEILKEKLEANVSLSIPGWLNSSLTPTEITLTDTDSSSSKESRTIDFLIILGENSNSKNILNSR